MLRNVKELRDMCKDCIFYNGIGCDLFGDEILGECDEFESLYTEDYKEVE